MSCPRPSADLMTSSSASREPNASCKRNGATCSVSNLGNMFTWNYTSATLQTHMSEVVDKETPTLADCKEPNHESWLANLPDSRLQFSFRRKRHHRSICERLATTTGCRSFLNEDARVCSWWAIFFSRPWTSATDARAALLGPCPR